MRERKGQGVPRVEPNPYLGEIGRVAKAKG